MPFSKFEALLRDSIGLAAASIGNRAIERAVRERQHACDLRDPVAYWERASQSKRELQELIDAVVVPETWFFREQEAFATLVRVVQEEWLAPHATGVLRMLSLPSSTGEEPYSMAMALLDAGVPPERFHIDAVDVSARAIAEAKRATYGKNSFRDNQLEFRDRYFERTPSGYRVGPLVRQQVTLQQGNLLADDLLPANVYSAVFCRNLLIYFDRSTQYQAVKVLERLLAPNGVLFVAPCEAGLLLDQGFDWIKAPMASAFRKIDGVVNRNRARPCNHPAGRHLALSPTGKRDVRPRVARASRALSNADVTSRTETADESTTGLEDAVLLANQGRFLEATQCCEAHIQRKGPSAEAFHLLGVILDARGTTTEAITYYQKALYLDPHHHGALMHLALLMEQLNRRGYAQLLRKRALRAQSGARSR